MKVVRDERGLALLSALLSVALLTLIVVEMTDATFVHSHLTRNAGNAISAQLLARSAQIGAEEALKEAGSNEQIQKFLDTFVDAAPLTLPTAQGYLMQIAISDETGRLNLNRAREHEEAFQNLLADLNLDPGLLTAVQARIDTDEQTAFYSDGGECALSIPCDPPRGELRALDDVRTIRGFTDAVVAQIRPFVTAYPTGHDKGTINLRTARPEVLVAIGCTNVESLPPVPRSVDDATAWKDDGDPCKDAKPGADVITSKVYTITTTATVGDATQSVEATVEVGKGPLTWKQRPVWGAGPGGVP